ncbi:MAG: glycosyl transferase [Spirochaetales bacterium]|nr:glycosyl transferase [Spirochaetales bacterium]
MERARVAGTDRVNLLEIPLDIVSNDQLEDRIFRLLNDGDSHQLVLLSLWDFIRARGRSNYAASIRSSSLILTSSKMVAFGAKFLRSREITRHMPFEFVIRLLSVLEKRRRSVYVIGGRPSALQTATSNLRGSFPQLQIVGRCAGYFPVSHEENILVAIRKAAPSLILGGKGLPGKNKWMQKHRKHFAAGLTYWCGSCIDVFSGKRKKTSRELWAKGLDFLPELPRNPLRFLRGFVYLWYVLLLLYHKARKI